VSLGSRTGLIRKILGNKKYRHAYVREHVRNGVPFQLRAMRDQREWTQARLGQEAGKGQNAISRLEDPNYGKVTIQTLLEMAEAFDVALLVKFVPFSRLLKEYEDVSPTGLSVKSISDAAEASTLEAWANEENEQEPQTPIHDATRVIAEVPSSTPQMFKVIEGTAKGTRTSHLAQRGLYPVVVEPLTEDATPQSPITEVAERRSSKIISESSTNEHAFYRSVSNVG
jgi:transcriptional regulator with XRE-family HTH domain